MMLDRAEFDEMLGLLRVAMSGALTMATEQRLRYLVARETTRAVLMPIPELVRTAKFVAGLYALQNGIYPQPARAPTPA